MGRDVRVQRTNLGPGLSEVNHYLMVVAVQGPSPVPKSMALPALAFEHGSTCDPCDS